VSSPKCTVDYRRRRRRDDDDDDRTTRTRVAGSPSTRRETRVLPEAPERRGATSRRRLHARSKHLSSSLSLSLSLFRRQWSRPSFPARDGSRISRCNKERCRMQPPPRISPFPLNGSSEKGMEVQRDTIGRLRRGIGKGSFIPAPGMQSSKAAPYISYDCIIIYLFRKCRVEGWRVARRHCSPGVQNVYLNIFK